MAARTWAVVVVAVARRSKAVVAEADQDRKEEEEEEACREEEVPWEAASSWAKEDRSYSESDLHDLCLVEKNFDSFKPMHAKCVLVTMRAHAHPATHPNVIQTCS